MYMYIHLLICFENVHRHYYGPQWSDVFKRLLLNMRSLCFVFKPLSYTFEEAELLTISQVGVVVFSETPLFAHHRYRSA